MTAPEQQGSPLGPLARHYGLRLKPTSLPRGLKGGGAGTA